MPYNICPYTPRTYHHEKQPRSQVFSFRDWEGREKTLEKRNVNHLPTHATAVGTKFAVAFASIFMSAVETEIISRSKVNWPLEWKRYIDDAFQLWDRKIGNRPVYFTRHHPTIKFAAEISEKETNFFDTTIFKGERFDIRTHFFKNRLKSINTRISIPATLQARKNDLSNYIWRKYFKLQITLGCPRLSR